MFSVEVCELLLDASILSRCVDLDGSHDFYGKKKVLQIRAGRYQRFPMESGPTDDAYVLHYYGIGRVKPQ